MPPKGAGLADALAAARHAKTHRPCKFSRLLDDLPADQRAAVDEALEWPRNAPGWLSDREIAVILRDAGFEIGECSIERHRRGSCSCGDQ